MKPINLLLAVTVVALSLVQSVLAYEPPRDAQISNTLANPKLITALLDDATGEEAAALVKRIIDRINAQALSQDQKDYLIAYYTGRVVSLLNETQAQKFATELFSIAPAANLGTVFAGLAVGRGGSSDFMVLLRQLAGTNETLLTAIATPQIPLSSPVYNQLVSNISNAQSIAPRETDSTPPTGDRTGSPTPTPVPAPVVPEPYNGQG